MQTEQFNFTAKVEIFPQKGGWTYVPVPIEFTEMSKDMADRGLGPIEARVGKTRWKASLLPMGDGTHFIALNAKVRKAESIKVGDEVEVNFSWRG